MWPVQFAYLICIACRIFLSSLTLLHFLHDRSSLSSPSFYSTTFQNSPGICDLLSQVSSFSTIHTCSNTLSVRGVYAHVLTGPSTVSTWIAQKPQLRDSSDVYWRQYALVSSCYRSLGGVFCFHLQCLLNPDEYKPKLANCRWWVFERKNHIDRTFYILLILLSHNRVKWTVSWATQVAKIEAAISPRNVGNLTKRHGAISKSPRQIRVCYFPLVNCTVHRIGTYLFKHRLPLMFGLLIG